MMLKVSDGADGWTLFDGVSQVNVQAVRHAVKSQEDLGLITVEGAQVKVLVARACFPRDVPLDVGVLEFYNGIEQITALYAAEVYVLNDSGNTIERFSAPKRGRK